VRKNGLEDEMDNNLKERLAVWARSKRRTFLEREGERKYLPDDCAAALQRIEELEAENRELREAGEVLFDAVRPLNGVNGVDLPLTNAMLGWKASLKGDSHE
jgi:hypothetical protein